MKPRVRLTKLLVRLAFACLGILIVPALCGPSYAGLFNRTCPAPAIAAPAVSVSELSIATSASADLPAAAAERRCILPWNCPNGQCRPHDEVNVNVVAPTPPLKIEGVPPVSVSIEPAPAPATPFPYGILLAALLPVVIVASVIAFMVRVGTSRG